MFPLEIWLEILSYSDLQSLGRSFSVNKRLSTLRKSKTLWSNMVRKDFYGIYCLTDSGYRIPYIELMIEYSSRHLGRFTLRIYNEYVNNNYDIIEFYRVLKLFSESFTQKFKSVISKMINSHINVSNHRFPYNLIIKENYHLLMYRCLVSALKRECNVNTEWIKYMLELVPISKNYDYKRFIDHFESAGLIRTRAVVDRELRKGIYKTLIGDNIDLYNKTYDQDSPHCQSLNNELSENGSVKPDYTWFAFSMYDFINLVGVVRKLYRYGHINTAEPPLYITANSNSLYRLVDILEGAGVMLEKLSYERKPLFVFEVVYTDRNSLNLTIGMCHCYKIVYEGDSIRAGLAFNNDYTLINWILTYKEWILAPGNEWLERSLPLIRSYVNN